MSPLAEIFGFGASWGRKALARELLRRGGQGLRVLSLSSAATRALDDSGQSAEAVELSAGRVERESGTADAVLASGLPPVDEALLLLGEMARLAKDGGLVLVASGEAASRRGPARESVAALFLHAGLVDLEQRSLRGVIVTSARVRR